MKKLIKKLEDIMVAVTFAEAGEYDEASRYSSEEGLPREEDATGPIPNFKKTAFESAGK